MLLLGIATSCNLHNNRQTTSKNPMKTMPHFQTSRISVPGNNPEHPAHPTAKEYRSTLEDSFHLAVIRNDFPEMENIFNKSEKERLRLKNQNNKLQISLFIVTLLFSSTLFVLLYYIHRKKCKIKQPRLSDTIKHSQWGFLVTKEFITENHIAYDELERTLNRAKGMNDINTEFYNKFHNLITRQKANYSGRLFNHLTTSNGNFETKFQQQFPNLSLDDFLLANMIHHRWDNSDMASILHLSQDALRKRKTRLNHKISAYLKKDIELDQYLTHF